MRTAVISRNTAETKINIELNLDGKGDGKIASGVGFLDHMLTLFASHGRFDLAVTCNGDTQVDDHHTVEDIGIALGEAFAKALGNKKGITRYGSVTIPMDETLILAALDLSGRCGFYCTLNIPSEKVGTFDTELVEEFFIAFTRNAGITLHIKQMSGKNTHHIIEGIFKSVARALSTAVQIDAARADALPSTKGVL
jgi:imidazoleglycerol-phosphate dehydratase